MSHTCPAAPSTSISSSFWPCHTYRVEKPAAAPENVGCFNQCGGVMGWCGIEMSFVQGGKCPLWQSGFVFPLRDPELQCIELRLGWKVQGYEHKTDLWWPTITGHKMEMDTFELQSGIDKVKISTKCDWGSRNSWWGCVLELLSL